MSSCIISFGNNKFGYGHLSRSCFLGDFLLSNNISLIRIQNINPFKLNNIYILDYDNIPEYLLAITSFLKEFSVRNLILDLPYIPEFSQIFDNFAMNFPNVYLLDNFYYNYQNVKAIINLHSHYLPNSGILNERFSLYSGIKYAIIRKEFHKLRRKKYFSKKKKLQIIISCGGTDPGKKTLEAIQICNKIYQKKIKLKALIINGRNIPKKIMFEHKFLNFPPDFPQLLRNSDIAILSGGTTCLEACFLGTPTIAIPQTKEEDNFFRYLEKKKLVIHKENPRLMEILRFDFREEMSNSQLKSVDQNGPKRILNIILGD